MIKPNIYSITNVKNASMATFRRFTPRNLKKEKAIIILPGGPGISSSYLNDFATQLSEKSNIETFIFDYPEHEEYNKGTFNSTKGFAELTEFLIDAILRLEELGIKEVNIIGHSFGAVQAAAIQKSLITIPIKHTLSIRKWLLLAPIFENGLSLRYTEASKAVANELQNDGHNLSSEHGFRLYWSLMLDLYFSKNGNEAHKGNLLRSTTWELNSGFTIGTPEVDSVLDTNNQNVHLFFGKEDHVSDNSHNSSTSKNDVIFLPGGHFFMLENPIESTEILMDYLLED